MSKTVRVKLDPSGQMIFPQSLMQKLKELNFSEFTVEVVNGKLQLDPIKPKKLQDKKVNLIESLRIAHELASEWKIEQDSVLAVREQRR
jgi:antitoxin component of MazEF toxin-antitoxin module